MNKEFEKWCGIIIVDDTKAPKAAALKRAYWNAWQAAWTLRGERDARIAEQAKNELTVHLIAAAIRADRE
jgi:hypothetical protein